LPTFKACDPELWGHTDIYSADVLNDVDDFMDSAAFHMEAVAFYAMVTHMYEGNNDTDDKANLQENYPVAYINAKLTEQRSIDVAALCDAVKSRLKAADLPNFCTRKYYFHAIAWLLASSENDEGDVVPINEVHVNHAKDNVPKPRLYRDLLDYILAVSINIDDGTVTAP
jgi:hypothetical protein